MSMWNKFLYGPNAESRPESTPLVDRMSKQHSAKDAFSTKDALASRSVHDANSRASERADEVHGGVGSDYVRCPVFLQTASARRVIAQFSWRCDLWMPRPHRFHPPPGHSFQIKSIVFGGLDGIITTFSTIASVAGGGLTVESILTLGVGERVSRVFLSYCHGGEFIMYRGNSARCRGALASSVSPPRCVLYTIMDFYRWYTLCMHHHSSLQLHRPIHYYYTLCTPTPPQPT